MVAHPNIYTEGLTKVHNVNCVYYNKVIVKDNDCVWSNILPRRNWSLCLSNKDGENWKARINSVIVVKNAYGSLYFKYTG